MPTAGSQPRGIVAAPDGAIWFAEGQGNKIGRITTGGNITEFAVPLANAQPWSITVGPDGALYFGEFGGGQIGRITTSGVFSGYTVPFAANNRVTVQLISITLGPDGSVHVFWLPQWRITAGRLASMHARRNRLTDRASSSGRDKAVER